MITSQLLTESFDLWWKLSDMVFPLRGKERRTLAGRRLVRLEAKADRRYCRRVLKLQEQIKQEQANA